MANILKEPIFYKTLGQLAQSLGDPRSFGAKAGMYGEQMSEDWAARKAQEKAEKEAKKAKRGKMFGSLGGTVGGLLGSLIPGVGPVVGPMLGSVAGKAGGTAAGGGDISLEDLGWTAASSALPGVLSKVGAKAAGAAATKAEVPAAEAPKVGAPETPKVTTPDLPSAKAPAPAPKASEPLVAETPKTALAETPSPKPGLLSKAFGPEAASRMSTYVQQRYGGWPGLGQELLRIPQQSEVPVSKFLKPYPGLSQEGFESLLRSNLAREGAEREAGESEWRRELAQQRMALEATQLGQAGLEPRPVEWTDEQGVRYRQYVPERSLLSLPPMTVERPREEPPQTYINQETGVAAFVDPRTRDVTTTRIPDFVRPERPNYRTQVVPGLGLFQIEEPPGGEKPIITKVPGTEPPPPAPPAPRPPVVQEFNTPKGVRPMQWNAERNEWVPVPGTTPKPPPSESKRLDEGTLTRLLMTVGDNLLRPWMISDPLTGAILGLQGENSQQAATVVQGLLAEMKRAYVVTGEIPSPVRVPADQEKGPGWTKIVFVFSDGKAVLPKVNSYLPPEPSFGE